MDYQAIVQIVSAVGFPIAMCCIMAWYVKYQADQHAAESKELRTVIDENTKILEGLKQLIADRLTENK